MMVLLRYLLYNNTIHCYCKYHKIFPLDFNWNVFNFYFKSIIFSGTLTDSRMTLVTLKSNIVLFILSVAATDGIWTFVFLNLYYTVLYFLQNPWMEYAEYCPTATLMTLCSQVVRIYKLFLPVFLFNNWNWSPCIHESRYVGVAIDTLKNAFIPY